MHFVYVRFCNGKNKTFLLCYIHFDTMKIVFYSNYLYWWYFWVDERERETLVSVAVVFLVLQSIVLFAQLKFYFTARVSAKEIEKECESQREKERERECERVVCIYHENISLREYVLNCVEYLRVKVCTAFNVSKANVKSALECKHTALDGIVKKWVYVHFE